MSKHTPGPYHIDREDNDVIFIYNIDEGMALAEINLSDRTEIGGEDEEDDADFNAEMEANAHLFAAAPLLLEALTTFLRDAHFFAGTFDEVAQQKHAQALAAYKAATGEDFRP